ncbi:thioesterase II family protein [Streptomyces platensis]|uniref:thioesterase II family protein n=1 Tax=Streptomyces platensis TaxID=58346 RepID=UPI002E80643C|nr:alpha/beta fold hydrolase [Streptomyces platensis]WUB78415.1 alpha/beta fold hydrolase [Streptomyces platensis]
MREQQGVMPGPAHTAPGTPYLTSRPTDSARLRLFCFHHSGGSAAAFSALRGVLAPHIEVVTVQLPGRETRLRHPLPPSMADLVAEIDEHLDPFLTGPYAFYGHSMGALVAHDLISRRQARGALPPVRLIAGACRAPHLPAAFAAQHAESDDHLVRSMLDIGGLSPELLRYPDWLQAAVSLNRGDLRLCASRDTTAVAPLPCPIDVFHGTDDPLVHERDARAWADRSTVSCRVHRFPGGHFFFLRESRAAFADRIAALLRETPEPARGT